MINLLILAQVASITITVPEKPKHIPDHFDLLVNTSITLKAIPRNAAGSPLVRTITWRSDNENVASVSSLGRVTGKTFGYAIITATAGLKSTTTVACVSPQSRLDLPVKVKKVTVQPDSTSLKIGQGTQFTAYVHLTVTELTGRFESCFHWYLTSNQSPLPPDTSIVSISRGVIKARGYMDLFPGVAIGTQLPPFLVVPSTVKRIPLGAS